MDITKKEAAEVIYALTAGVVPKKGLEYIIVGQDAEIAQIKKDLALVSQGFSVTKFISGPFGSGKSFFQTLIQHIAQEQNFVTTKVDFSPYRKLYHTSGQAVALYTELIKNIATKNFGNENTLEMIIQEWLTKIFDKVSHEQSLNIDFNDETFLKAVHQTIYQEIDRISGVLGGNDFAQVLIKYFEGFTRNDFQLQKNAIKWISGEYATKTAAKTDLQVGNIIDDTTYFEYLKVLTKFFTIAGYAGFVVNFDECVNLYKLSHSTMREKNYEMILKIYNDTLSDKTKNLFITFSGTPEFITDEQRGLYSYGALKTRLQLNHYDDKFKDFSHPIIQLTPMSAEEIFVLLDRVLYAHQIFYDYDTTLVAEDLEQFIQENYAYLQNKIIVIRDILVKFIGSLNRLQQHPDIDKKEIFGQIKPSTHETLENDDKDNALLNRFSKFI